MTGPSGDGALTAPAVARNREPILAVLRRVLPTQGTVLEIASGSGEHAMHFAAGLPHLTWQPADIDPDALRSIAAYRAAARLPNLLPPLALDAAAPDWPVTRADAMVSINMIHIAPWSAAQGLMAGAERMLAAGDVLYLYGPFKEDGQHTAPSNAAFDLSLRHTQSAMGRARCGRRLRARQQHGLALVERVAMPANNLSLVFRYRAT